MHALRVRESSPFYILLKLVKQNYLLLIKFSIYSLYKHERIDHYLTNYLSKALMIYLIEEFLRLFVEKNTGQKIDNVIENFVQVYI